MAVVRDSDLNCSIPARTESQNLNGLQDQPLLGVRENHAICLDDIREPALGPGMFTIPSPHIAGFSDVDDHVIFVEVAIDSWSQERKLLGSERCEVGRCLQGIGGERFDSRCPC